MLSDLRASAETPDAQVLGSISGLSSVRIDLAPGYFHRMDAADLQHQLTRLMPLLMDERERAYTRLRSVDFGTRPRPESTVRTPRQREYVAERDQIATSGGTPDSLQMSTTGLQHWSVLLNPEWCSRADEHEVCRSASEAASETIRLFAIYARKAKIRIFG